MKHLTVDEIKQMILESVKIEHKTEDYSTFVAVSFRTKNGREFAIEFDLIEGGESEIGTTLNDAVFESIDYGIRFDGLDFAVAHKEVMKEDEQLILKKLKFI